MNKSINSIDNYKQTLIETNDIVMNKYLDIIHEYIMFAISNIHIQKYNYLIFSFLIFIILLISFRDYYSSN